ncbi:MAG: DNA polymerase III subunit delta [Alphaproteobacteria bacterium]|nr:DNA polymerase III subunit delta [Alphaproteobacteria bacterium]
MKISPRELDGYLKHPQKSSAALIYGSDAGQVRQRTRELTEGWQGKDQDPLSRIEFAPEHLKDDPARLADELASMSLMGGRRVVTIREASDAILPIVQDALGLRSHDNFLILQVTEGLGRDSKLRAWAEKMPDIACIAIYKDEGGQLDQFLRDTLRGFGLRASSDVVSYLATQLGGDRQIMLNELEKLSLYVGDEAEHVSLEDAMAVIGENNDKSLEDLAKAIAAGDTVSLCKLTDRLLAEGHMGVVLVRAVMRYFDTLEKIAALRRDGLSIELAIEKLYGKIAFKIVPAMKPHALRWGSNRIADALAVLQRLELDSKRHAEQSRMRLASGFMEIASFASTGKKAA